MGQNGEFGWLTKENNLMNRLVYISHLMRDCDALGDLLNKEEYTRFVLNEIQKEQILIGNIYLKYVEFSRRLHLSCSEDIVKQWHDYLEQSADFWRRWEWKCYWR
jgi:hypothetical protein